MPLGLPGADKSAVGTMNRPLQAFCLLLRCPGYFVKLHYRAQREGQSVVLDHMAPHHPADAINRVPTPSLRSAFIGVPLISFYGHGQSANAWNM